MQKTSQILESLLTHSLQQKSITLGALIECLESRIYGLGILIFALPSIAPLSAIPGIAALFSLPIILLGGQLIFGKKKPWFPQWLKRKSIETIHLKKLLNYIIPYLRRIETVIKPRYFFFSSIIVKIFTGLLIVWLSILLMLPIPFSNMLFGGLIGLLALGLIEKDGLILFIGLIFGTITVTLYIKAAFLLLELLL